MKNFFSVALAAVFTAVFTFVSFSLSAAEPYALNKQGAEAEYVLKDAKGNPMTYTKTTVKELTVVDDSNYTATTVTETFAADRTPLATPVTVAVEVKDGVVQMAPDMSGMMEGATVEGTLPTYSADLSVGQVVEYDYVMKVMGVEASTKGKDTVLVRENITTPAGTFDCLKIQSEVTTKVMMQNIKMKVVSWLAAGVGVVKSETYLDKDKLQMTNELISLKK